MRFGVLGPLAVWTADGTAVRLPERKVRALLAALLANPGRVVSADRLVDHLWGEDLPVNPVDTLRLKVSRLRRVLAGTGTDGRDLVALQPPGYVLRVDPADVDMHRFEAGLATARQTADPRTRAALLADALALWRGPAFADFADEDFARTVITRLTEARLTALEEHAEARLELGEHGGPLTAELGDLVAQHPLRERLRAVQMRALYRAGRQSEALASYADLRGRLTEDLGIDPSAELAALHQAILTQDPALDTPVGPPTNLPAPITGLIGREAAVGELRGLLADNRLVTLVGPGGVGKTRLAVEVASHPAAAFPDGAWLVELAGHGAGGPAPAGAAPSGPAEAVMRVLGIRDDPSAQTPPRPAADRLSDALRTRRLLLVLDNCEHVVEPLADLVAALSRAAAGLRVLATSREPLGLAGEVLYPVPPLDLPDPAAGDDPEVLRRSGAVRLFVTRAAAAAPGFALDDGNAAAVAALCRRLDGIPLALELAATRVRALGVRELVARLDDRFRLLAADRRGVPARQRTLRAVIDWSWDLLTDPERVVLRRLSVHAEGCTLAAAEAVCAGAGTAAESVADLLARLVDRSLVVVTHDADGPRYRLLESVAAYCTEQLRAAGESRAVRDRHTRYYVELAERAEPLLRGHDQRQWLTRLDVETANLRGALDNAVRHDVPRALRLVNAMTWYWVLRGRLGEAVRSLRAVLAVAGAGQARTAVWLAGVSVLAGGDVDEAAFGLHRDIDDPLTRGRAQWFLAFSLYRAACDLPASDEWTDRALATLRPLDDGWGMAAALGLRAWQALARGDLAALRRDGERSLVAFGELGDRWGQVQTAYPLAALAEITGDYARAERLHRDGLRMAEQLGLLAEAADRVTGLGRVALLTGDLARADELHHRAVRLAAGQGYHAGEIHARIGLGLGARRAGRLDDAEAHLRAALSWHRQVDFGPGPALLLAELGCIAELRGDAGTALALHRDALAVASATGDPRAVALASEGLAGAHAAAGRYGEAARLLGGAAALRESLGAPLPPAERGDVERSTAATVAALGAAEFTRAFEDGAAAPPAA